MSNVNLGLDGKEFDYKEMLKSFFKVTKLEKDIEFNEEDMSFCLNERSIKVYDGNSYLNSVNLKDDFEKYDGFLVVKENIKSNLGYKVKCFPKDTVSFNPKNKNYKYFLDMNMKDFFSVRKMCGLFAMWY